VDRLLRTRWQKDVPEEAKQKLKFSAVENVDEVLAVALEKDGAVPASEGKSA
jgi:ATP-dependent Lon protease